MPDTRFEVEDRMASRLACVSIRGEDGQFADFALAPPNSAALPAHGETDSPSRKDIALRHHASSMCPTQSL
jgi:hypothetical protein